MAQAKTRSRDISDNWDGGSCDCCGPVHPQSYGVSPYDCERLQKIADCRGGIKSDGSVPLKGPLSGLPTSFSVKPGCNSSVQRATDRNLLNGGAPNIGYVGDGLGQGSSPGFGRLNSRTGVIDNSDAFADNEYKDNYESLNAVVNDRRAATSTRQDYDNTYDTEVIDVCGHYCAIDDVDVDQVKGKNREDIAAQSFNRETGQHLQEIPASVPLDLHKRGRWGIQPAEDTPLIGIQQWMPPCQPHKGGPSAFNTYGGQGYGRGCECATVNAPISRCGCC